MSERKSDPVVRLLDMALDSATSGFRAIPEIVEGKVSDKTAGELMKEIAGGSAESEADDDK